MNLLIINDWGISPKAGLMGGGAENRIILLINEFLSSGKIEQIHVIFGEEKLQNQCFPENKVFFHPFKASNFFSIYNFTNHIIKKYKIDIIQIHNTVELKPFSVLSGRKNKVPVIWFAHDFWPLCGMRSFISPYDAMNNKLCDKVNVIKCIKCEGWKSYLRLKYVRFILNKADLAIAPGVKIKNIFENNGVLKNKWRIVKPWINTEYSASYEDIPRKDILFVGSLLPYKGAWVAVEALKYILEKIPDAKLKIVGQDQEKNNIYRNKIEEIAKRDGVVNNIEFLGTMDKSQLIKEYQKSAVFVFPTICQELFGLVWAEAMANGCPVVAADIGGVAEYVKNYGVLFHQRDFKTLSEEVIRILKNSEYAKDLSIKAKKYVIDNFNIKNASREMMKIYDELKSKK